MANSDPNQLTDAEKTKAKRAKMILYAAMVVFVVLPVVVYWLTR